MEMGDQDKSSESTVLVYAGPSRASSLIDRVSDPSKLQIVHQSGSFTSIQLGDGRRGFVETRFLNLPIVTLKLNADNVPMYQSASMNSIVRTKLTRGVLIEC